MNKIGQVKQHLHERSIDGWLLYDFQKSNDLAHRFLELAPHLHVSRRFFYWIPKEAEPVKIVHAIEPDVLDHWPGEKKTYSSWQELGQILANVLRGKKQVAMEYVENGHIPYVSKVDKGTIEWVESFGPSVVSSADFLLYLTSILSAKQIQSHKRAAAALLAIVDAAWNKIQDTLDTGIAITEREVQLFIEEKMEAKGLIADHPCIVAAGKHSANPHFATPKEGSSLIRRGDWILIDLWGKEKEEGAVFADLTQVAIAAKEPSIHQKTVFEAVQQAQKKAIDLISTRFAAKQRIEGWEVDESARSAIAEAGFGPFFIHRTGHNIETHLHGSGANMDNLETHDTRPLLPMTCFSIEPGIYLPEEFGVRLETDVVIGEDGRVEITAGTQDAVRCLL